MNDSNKLREQTNAFTLLELAVVLTCISLLAVLILPAFAGSTSSKNKSIQCMQNQKQVMAAMLMYSQDFNDYLPPNPDDGNNLPGHNWCTVLAWSYTADELARTCLLMPYLQTNTTIFRCTEDQQLLVNPATPQTAQPIVRSISMSQAVGTVCPVFGSNGAGHGGKPTLSVNGPWLNNSHSHHRNFPYRTYGKTAEIVSPTPAGLWVTVEEEARSGNDASFAFGMATAEWIDYPSTLHEFGCVFGFGDGHTELRKWTDPRTKLAQLSRTNVPGSLDWRWMADRTSARAQ